MFPERGARRSISMNARDRVRALSSLELIRVPGNAGLLKSTFLESVCALRYLSHECDSAEDNFPGT